MCFLPKWLASVAFLRKFADGGTAVTALHSIVGLLGLTTLAWLMSEQRRALDWRVPLVGIVAQLLLAALLLKVPASRYIFSGLNDMVLALQEATEVGTSFLFGYLGGGPLPFEETRTGGSLILAFRSLPLVIVVSALTALFTYWRVLPMIVRAASWLLERTLGVGGAVGLAAAANIFLGMVEAPLVVRAYLGQLSRSELFVVMCTGMATISGTMLLLYASVLGDVIPDAIGHLLTASLISAPAAIMVARIMVPSAGPPTAGTLMQPMRANSTMDAITEGTQSGLRVFLNIVAMLLVLVALVHLANAFLGLLPGLGGTSVSLERVLGWLMAPVAWLMGIPWADALTAGSLLGTKTILTEFLAYLQLVDLPVDALGERSRLIMTYALCGFANFGSLGIMIGGLATLVPERRAEIVGLGIKSIIGGTLATCLTGTVVGLLHLW